MKLIFYILVFNILILVKVKEKTEIRSNNRPKLRRKKKVIIWKGDRPRRAGGPIAHIQFHPINRRRIIDVQERVDNLVMVWRQNSQVSAKGHRF